MLWGVKVPEEESSQPRRVSLSLQRKLGPGRVEVVLYQMSDEYWQSFGPVIPDYRKKEKKIKENLLFLIYLYY